MRLPEDDRCMMNFIYSMEGEYGDELLAFDTRERLVRNLSEMSCLRIRFYPFDANKDELLLINDIFGTFTGEACDKVSQAFSLVSKKEYKEAVQHRYQNRKNLVVTENPEDFRDKRFSYILMNLDETGDFDWNNSYEVDKYFVLIKRFLKEDGKLLILSRGDYHFEYHLERILFRNGFSYQYSYDSVGNGGLFWEAGRKDFDRAVSEDELKEMQIRNLGMILANSWIQRNQMIYMGGVPVYQDQCVIGKVRTVVLDILKELLEVCNRNGLTVYPIYGTLLGLMRDGGMIKDDDDIDVAMPRKDFMKLMELQGEFREKYFLQTPDNDSCFYGGYLKLRNRETTCIHPQNEFVNACEGIGIDIIPLDICYENKDRENGKINRIIFLQRLLYAKEYGYFKNFKDMPMLKWKFFKYLGKLFDKRKLIAVLYGTMSRGDKKASHLGIYTHYKGDATAVHYVEKKWFKDSFTMNFEGMKMQVPIGWHELLAGRYGDYNNRWGFNEGMKRHGFYDVDTPYTVYKKRFSGLHNPRTISELIVFIGDGTMFKYCYAAYKDRVKIAHMVLLPGVKSQPEYSVDCKAETWEEFVEQDISKDTYRAVICSLDVRNVEKILRKEGYKEYYIFWYERNWMTYANSSAMLRDMKTY